MITQINNNAYKIATKGKEILQSYRSLVAKRQNGKKYISKRYYKYSVTTSKHIGIFFEMSSKEIERAIKDKEIKLIKEITL